MNVTKSKIFLDECSFFFLFLLLFFPPKSEKSLMWERIRPARVPLAHISPYCQVQEAPRSASCKHPIGKPQRSSSEPNSPRPLRRRAFAVGPPPMGSSRLLINHTSKGPCQKTLGAASSTKPLIIDGWMASLWQLRFIICLRASVDVGPRNKRLCHSNLPLLPSVGREVFVIWRTWQAR